MVVRWSKCAIVLFMLSLAGCGGGSSGGGGGGANFAAVAGNYSGTYNVSLTAAGLPARTLSGVVAITVTQDGVVTAVFDGESDFPVTGRVDDSGAVTITVPAVPFGAEAGCTSGSVSMSFSLAAADGSTLSGTLVSDNLVCSGVAIGVSGQIDSTRV